MFSRSRSPGSSGTAPTASPHTAPSPRLSACPVQPWQQSRAPHLTRLTATHRESRSPVSRLRGVARDRALQIWYPARVDKGQRQSTATCPKTWHTTLPPAPQGVDSFPRLKLIGTSFQSCSSSLTSLEPSSPTAWNTIHLPPTTLSPPLLPADLLAPAFRATRSFGSREAKSESAESAESARGCCRWRQALCPKARGSSARRSRRALRDGMEGGVLILLVELLWMDKFLHHLETVGNHSLLVIRGNHPSRVSEVVWDFVHPQHGSDVFLFWEEGGGG